MENIYYAIIWFIPHLPALASSQVDNKFSIKGFKVEMLLR